MSNGMGTTALVEARGLCRFYPDGQVHALRGVDLTLAVGDYLAIMGPSGCGKSTLLHLLGGLDRPTAGEVRFAGVSLAEQGDLARFRARELGFVFQSFFLLPALTAEENVQVPMFEGPPRTARQRRMRAGELLELVGLAHRRRHLPRQLSVGERQRVALARALANEPRLLLADEPTGNLDSASAAVILELLDDLQRRAGLTLVLVTHDLQLAFRAQRVIHLRDGQIEREQPVLRLASGAA